MPAGIYKDSANGATVNTTYIYARDQWASPLMHLPVLQSVCPSPPTVTKNNNIRLDPRVLYLPYLK